MEAPYSANLNLIAQLAMGGFLLLGMVLARRKMFRAHAVCQSSVVLLNLLPISMYMAPVFHSGVMPGLFGKLGEPFYAVAATHALIGTVAETLGLYIILRAGTNLLPLSLRFTKYKPWMRAELALWWLAIALGLTTYFVWYTGNDRKQPAVPPPAQVVTGGTSDKSVAPLTETTIVVRNFAFEPKEVTVVAGSTIVWKNETGRHTAVADDNNFESTVMAPGDEFRRTFSQPGVYPYYCSLHGSAGGKDMAGVITVTASK
jgi:plastocyanin/uncharacterized membrane protein YozB (DUF420 family)